MEKEDGTYDLPDDVAEKLLCSECFLYISCGPVKIGPNGNSICGRCSSLHFKKTLIHNELFEASMSNFRFPCRNKADGCNQRVRFGRSIEHENICPYKTFLCPSMSQDDDNCTEFLNSINIYKHFIEGHNNLVLLNGQFQLDLAKDSASNFIMKHNEINVIIQYKYDKAKRRLLLNIAYPSKVLQWQIYYNLEVITNTTDLDSSVRSKRYSIGLYDSNSPFLNEYNSNIFDIGHYLPVTSNLTAVTIKLILGDIVERNIGVTEKAFVPWDFLKKYGCDICYEIPVPPLYSYLTGENENIACSKCFKYYTGPHSDTMYSFVQNDPFVIPNYKFTEVDINKVNFQCRWKGCSFIGNADEIKLHTTGCQFEASICPVIVCNTGYYLKNNVIDHMKQHGKYCSDSKYIAIDFFVKEDSKNKDTAYYFTIWEDKLIIFESYRHSDKYVRIKCRGTSKQINFKVYFVHDHCSLTSKVFICKNDLPFCITSCITQLPRCFGQVRSLRGIFAITD